MPDAAGLQAAGGEQDAGGGHLLDERAHLGEQGLVGLPAVLSGGHQVAHRGLLGSGGAAC